MRRIANWKAIASKGTVVTVVFSLFFVAIAGRQPHHAAGATNGKIVYASDDGVNVQIYSSNPDGSERTQLTNEEFTHLQPSWSPDGSKIAYAADPNNDGTFQIFIMYADGSQKSQITTDGTYNAEPKWSPDGTKLAFTHAADGSSSAYIYTMRTDGGAKTKISNGAHNDTSPAWKSDGSRLVYTCPDGTWDQLCLVNPDGSSQTQLTSDALEHDTGAWSPDGSKIAYTSSNHPYDHHLVIINADGTNKHDLSGSGNYDNRDVSWSPDGTKLLYDGQGVSISQRIFVANTDGSNETPISPEGNYSFTPNWQIFSSDNDADGIPNSTEASGPNNGDANNDGTSDQFQRNITSIISPTGKYETLESTCTANTGVSASNAPANRTDKDNGFTYPAGLMAFTLECPTPGATTTVTLYSYGTATADTLVLRKYNPTAHTYQTIPGVTITSATIGGQNLTKATYTITDGGSLDQDHTANGIIVDPVGIASPVVGAPNTGLGGTEI